MCACNVDGLIEFGFHRFLHCHLLSQTCHPVPLLCLQAKCFETIKLFIKSPSVSPPISSGFTPYPLKLAILAA
jgi:hypothetical protein